MTDILIEYAKMRSEKLRNSKEIAIAVRNMVKKFDDQAKIIHFGSTARGDWNANSDIDILIILKDQSMKDQIILKVYGEFDAPLELHFCTEDQFRNWYLKFIDVYKEL